MEKVDVCMLTTSFHGGFLLPIIQFDFTGSVRNRWPRRGQGRLVNHRQESLLPLQHPLQVSNRFGDVFFELRSCLINEGFVLRLGLGDPHFDMCCAIYPILKGMGDHNLWRARNRK